MRNIDKIIIHCSATPEGRQTTVDDITSWHKARGFRTIGYHYVIYLDGSIHPGRPVAEIGAHCLGQNTSSIGICYIGGMDADNKNPKDTRTKEQRCSLIYLIKSLKKKYPNARVFGHRDFANKACPCFNAKSEYANL